jgi:hypothetical protein
MQLQTQIEVRVPPTEPKHIATKEYVDAGDEGMVRYDEDGNISYPAGLSLRVEMPDGTKHDVLRTDTNGNILLGEDDRQVNITAAQRPTIQVGSGAPDNIVVASDIADHVTQAALDAELAYKADLVDSVVPTSQMPPGAIPHNFTVATEADLVTLTTAIPNDRAKVTATSEIWLLWKAPATDAGSWENITALGSGSGGGGAGVVSVNGLTGAVTLDLPELPGVQNALDDKADASDLAAYAPLNSPAFTGTPTVPTPPANATGQQIINAEALNTKLTGNLGVTNPVMDGSATAGAATTVARSDHVHPSDTSRIAVADLSVAEPLANGTASAGTSTKVSREDHVHPVDTTTRYSFIPDYEHPIVIATENNFINTYIPATSTAGVSVLGTLYTAPQDGFIYFAINVLFSGSTKNTSYIGIVLNGNTYGLLRAWVLGSSTTELTVVTGTNFIPVKKGDTFQIWRRDDGSVRTAVNGGGTVLGFVPARSIDPTL